MTTDNEALKQVTADDIGGFVATVTALLNSDKLESSLRENLDTALTEIGNGFDAGCITKPDTMSRWLSAALIANSKSAQQQPEAERVNITPQWQDAIIEKSIANECLVLRIARSHTEWDVLRPESSIQLAALLNSVDEDDHAVLLELYQWFCFMSTKEFSRAFQDYRQQVLDWSKGGEANE